MSSSLLRSSSVPFCLSCLPLGAHAVSVSSFSRWYGLCCKPKSYHLFKMGAAANPAWISPSAIDCGSLFRSNWSTCYLVSQRRPIKTCSCVELRGARSLVLRVCEFELFCDIFSPDVYQERIRHCKGLSASWLWTLFQKRRNLFSIRPRLGSSPAGLF